MKSRVQKILISLEDIKDDLLGYSDDVWLEVDHNNSKELKKAFDFKKS